MSLRPYTHTYAPYGLREVVLRASGGDDGPAINAVIAAATGPTRIVLPDPIYLIATQVLVNKDGITLVGSGVEYDGTDRTWLYVTTNITGPAILFTGTIGGGLTGISLTLGATTGDGIGVKGCNDLHLRDFEVKLSTGKGLVFNFSGVYSTRVWCDRFLVVATTGTGIEVYGAYLVSFSDFQVTITGTGVGVDLLGSDDCHFDGYGITAPLGGICVRINGGDYGSSTYSASHQWGSGYLNGESVTRLVSEGDGFDVTGRRQLFLGLSMEDSGGSQFITADVGAMPSFLDTEGRHNFRTDLRSTGLLLDDFMAATPAGALGWASTGTTVLDVPYANHPGVVAVSTSAVSGTIAGLSLGAAGAGLLPAGPFIAEFIFALGDPSSTIARVGLMSSVADPPTDGIYLEKLTGDAQWYAVCRSGGVDSTRRVLGNSTLAASALAGASNVKMTDISGLSVGQNLYIAGAGGADNIAISAIGSAGASGSGITLASPLTHNHANGDGTSGLTTYGGWIRLTIRRHNNEAIDLFVADEINGNGNARITADHIPTAALFPAFTLKNGSASDRRMAVDAFQLLMTGLSR